MKALLIILCFAFTMACRTEDPSQASPGLIPLEDQQTLKHLKEVEWPKAYREQDTLLLDRILGDDFQMIDNSGAWSTKKDELNWIRENAPQYDTFRFEIKRLDILPNGTALICGTGHIVKDTVRSVYQSSNILVKRKGVWKAVASHVSGYKNIE